MALHEKLLDQGYRPVRVYTAAMRFPRMIGKGLRGERLIGGPYMVAQFLGAGSIFGLSGISAAYMPIGNPLVNLVVGAVIGFLVGSALAAVPVDGIKLSTRLSWILGLLVSTAPTASEAMPTESPVAIVGGDVVDLSPPRVKPHTRRRPPAVQPPTPPSTHPGDGRPTGHAPLHPLFQRRSPAEPTPAGTPGPGTSTPAAAAPAAAAASVFGALTTRP
ncbi:hypothetical protein [Mycolicibacterium mucogenicum]|jgi:hypothetical protein|uniref:hypothetical protein n=2 Tax=Mycolicibacterium mucogenicum TaxID=56689 RepID=UPI00076A30E7|nr:hypothetical protein [Mycolicibacterium mucogenicum]